MSILNLTIPTIGAALTNAAIKAEISALGQQLLQAMFGQFAPLFPYFLIIAGVIVLLVAQYIKWFVYIIGLALLVFGGLIVIGVI